MAAERNPIYIVNFENYLKPKVQFKETAVQPKLKPKRKPKAKAKAKPQPQSQSKPQAQRSVKKEEKSSFETFCEFSSIHGLNMLVATKDAPKYEQVGWQLVIFSAFAGTLFGLYKSVIINASTPTVTHIESTHNPVFNVPFPAVTLCSLNRLSKERGQKLAEKFASNSDLSVSEVQRLFQAAFYVNENIDVTPDDYLKFDEVLLHNNYSLLEFFKEVTPNCMEELMRCMWKGRSYPCDALFEPVLVPMGHCCSFNYFARPMNQFIRNVQSITSKIPRHVSGCGAETALTVLIDPRTDDYLAGYFLAPGYRVVVHDAFNIPESNSDNDFIFTQSEAYMSVQSEVTYGTKYLRNMGFLRRGCTFDPEHPLKYFREYSFWNCLAECLSFRVLERCKCIPYHMPRFLEQKLCNLTQHKCIINETEIFQELMDTSSILGTSICGCMPECSFNSYHTITSVGQLNRTFANGKHRFFKGITVTDQILLHVFFSDLSSTLYRMDALESWQSLVGTIGGIVGIAMGFSVVSLMEILFFFIARPLYLKGVKLVTWVKANRR